MKQYDVIIIGGGASGIIAALSIKKHHEPLSVCLIDQTFALGRKILISGAGRCNITNASLHTDPETKYQGNRSFIASIFKQFDYQNIRDFFIDLGVELYEEEKGKTGKIFPITDSAKTVLLLLEDELKRKKVDVILSTVVTKIQKDNETFSIDIETKEEGQSSQKETIHASKIIVATGGKTYPALGSNGSGYVLAKTLGHTMTEVFPSAVPLIAKNALIHACQGLKMTVEMSAIVGEKKVAGCSGDVLYTAYGLSGSGILSISRAISEAIHTHTDVKTAVLINFFPQKTKVDVKEILEKRWEKRNDQSIEKSLYGLLPNKFVDSLLKVLAIPSYEVASAMSEKKKDALLEALTAYEIEITDTRGWNEAEFTGGGLQTDEILSGTLESKKVSGVYVAGEILDVDGPVGGFNLSWAFASGWVAGKLQ